MVSLRSKSEIRGFWKNLMAAKILKRRFFGLGGANWGGQCCKLALRLSGSVKREELR